MVATARELVGGQGMAGRRKEGSKRRPVAKSVAHPDLIQP